MKKYVPIYVRSELGKGGSRNMKMKGINRFWRWEMKKVKVK
jgi:hypothetical protein